MRQCPLCSRLFEDSYEFCSHDGTALRAPDQAVGKILDSKYRVESLIATGGQGAVYRATHIHLQRPVAIKIVRGEFGPTSPTTERFKREARVVARLVHPNIVTIHDFGISDEVGVYIVMEFLDGHSLRMELKGGHRVPVETA